MDPDLRDQLLGRTRPRKPPVVVIESPFAGDLPTNIQYADALLFDSLKNGEIPFMGHLLYPRVFDDHNPDERDAGIRAHTAMIERCDYIVLGLDLGAPTNGMKFAISIARDLDKPIVTRHLGPAWRDTIVHRTKGFV